MKYQESFKVLNDNFVRRISDGAEISIKSDYYEGWLAEGNVPEPADPIIQEPVIDPVEKLRQFLVSNPDVAAIL